MSLTTLKSIQSALNLVDSKKESLRKAFEELQSHSPPLSSIDFTWRQLESHFASIQSELVENLSKIQALGSSKLRKPKREKHSASNSVPARAELKSFCEKMDGLGLRRFVMDRPKERAAVRVELADALKHAPDPGSLVLSALEGFFGVESGELTGLRRAGTVLLEELRTGGFVIEAEVKERARVMAGEWKRKMVGTSDGDDDDNGKEGAESLEKLGYLQLLASFGLASDGVCDVDELIDYAVLVARFRQAVELCRILGLESRVSDIVQKLISKGKQLLALKFIFEFDLTDEFPPVPLLKVYVMNSMKVAQKARKTGKTKQTWNEATAKEISALKSVIKFIEDHDLESQYPKSVLLSHIEKLEKEKADRKRPAPSPVSKPQRPVSKPQQNVNQQQTKQNGNWPKKAAGASNPNTPPFKRKKIPQNFAIRQPQPVAMRRAGLLPDHVATYLSPSGGAYASATPYSGPPYGLPGGPTGFTGNPNIPAQSAYHPREMAAAQPVYYDSHHRAATYGGGGYEMAAQYHPGYYQPK